MFFDSLAYAMGQAGAPAAGAPAGNPFMSFLPLILIFGIFYFLLIRPQQKRQKEHKLMIDNLTRGDRVVTAGGIYGRVLETSTETLTLDLGNNISIEVGRPYIAAVLTPEQTKEKEKGKKKK